MLSQGNQARSMNSIFTGSVTFKVLDQSRALTDLVIIFLILSLPFKHILLHQETIFQVLI
jgi:hypothetical protein